MSSGIKSWLNISPGVASSPQCVTQVYEIHSQGVRIIMLNDHGRDLSCSLYFWGLTKSVLTAGSVRSPVTPSPVDASERWNGCRCQLKAHALPVLMSSVEVFAHNSWASALFSQPLLRPVFDLQMLDPFERHIA
jgi:hypothetical protein